MPEFGASFSLHRCSELGIDKKKLLRAALKELGFRRFRLMSYWNIHEQEPGKYDFTELDWQLDMIAKYKGKVTLCLGKRQPRWPECHMPGWAKKLPKNEWYEALYTYVRTVVERYKDHPAIHSWQLENEALLKEFGYCEDKDYSHERLHREFAIVKETDPHHPVIMTLSDSWGIPWRRPKPDMYAMSLYRITINKHGNYAYSKRPAMFYRLRVLLIRLIKNRKCFIHELQAEPWLKTAIKTASIDEQLQRMNSKILEDTIRFAERTRQNPIDLWGLEWWYWLRLQGRPELWETVKTIMKRG